MSMEVVIYACQQAVPDPEALRGGFGKGGIKVQVIPEPCSSKVEAFQLLRTLAANVDLVWVIGCPEDLCRYSEGSSRLGSRVAYTRRYLTEIGLQPDRLGRSLVTPGDVGGLAAVVAEIKARLAALGPSPLKEKAEKVKKAKG
jgi:F420-non-reducing hydrogenase iron-sulfur subunit